jgi:DNA-binding MarR family transcriptional regulator
MSATVRHVDRTANLLGATGLALHDRIAGAMADASGRSMADAAALNAIGQAPGTSIRAVAIVTGLTHPGAVRVIDRLERDGLVERGAGADGRTVGVRLTAAGASLFRRQTRARAEALEALVAGLSVSDRVALEELLVALLGALTTSEEQAEHTCRLCDESSCPQERCPVTLAVEP